MNILQLLYWFVAYSLGIAGLSLAGASYLKARSSKGRTRFYFLLSFSIVIIPEMLNHLFQASGFLWTMRQRNFEILTTTLTVVGFWGAVYLACNFLSLGVPEKYHVLLNRMGRALSLAVSAAVFLYVVLPLTFLGILSTVLTGCVLILLPGASLFAIVFSVIKREASVYTWSGIITVGFTIFYGKVIPGQSFLILPAFYIGFSLAFLPVLFKSLSVQPSLVPDQQRLDALGISPRERDVVHLLLLGHSYREIAEKLFISLPTVQTHVTRIYQKAGVKSKMELLRLFST